MFSNPLDNPKTFDRYDQKNIHDQLLKIPQHFEVSWQQGQFVTFSDLKKINQIVLCGTGYSYLAAQLAKSISSMIHSLPVEISEGYRLPSFVDKQTLVIILSLGGNELPIVSQYLESLHKESHLLVISSGGKIKDLAIENHTPNILLEDRLLNPSSESTKLTSLFAALLGFLSRYGTGNHLSPEKNTAVLERAVSRYSNNILSSQNPAKDLATKYKGKGVIVHADSHLSGISAVFCHYLREQSHVYSAKYEGVAHFPSSLKDDFQYLLINSHLYPKLVSDSMETLRQKLQANKLQLTVIKPESPELLEQIFETLVFCYFFSYYLSIVNQQIPS